MARFNRRLFSAELRSLAAAVDEADGALSAPDGAALLRKAHTLRADFERCIGGAAPTALGGTGGGTDAALLLWSTFLAASASASSTVATRALDVLQRVKPDEHQALLDAMCACLRVSVEHGAVWLPERHSVSTGQLAASLAILRAASSSLRPSAAFELARSIVDVLVAPQPPPPSCGDDAESRGGGSALHADAALRAECCAFVAEVATAAPRGAEFVAAARARCCAAIATDPSATALELAVALVDAAAECEREADALRVAVWRATLHVLVSAPGAELRRGAALRVAAELERPRAAQHPPFATRVEEAWAATTRLARARPGDALLLTSALAARCYFPGPGDGAAAGGAAAVAAKLAVQNAAPFWDLLARCVVEGRRGDRKHAVYLIRCAARGSAAPWSAAQWETLCRCIESMDEHVYHLIEPSWSFAMESLGAPRRSAQGHRWVSVLLQVALEHPTFRVRRLALHAILRSPAGAETEPVRAARVALALRALNESRRLCIEAVRDDFPVDVAEAAALAAAEAASSAHPHVRGLPGVTSVGLLVPGREARAQTATHWYACVFRFCAASSADFATMVRVARTVSFLSFTVTLYANLAHSLTRSP